jgi:hypothetical protein
MEPTAVLSNSRDAIKSRIAEGTVSSRSVWGMLLLRPALALTFQLLFTAGYAISGASDPRRAAADWWLGSFALGEVINLWLLVRLAHREGLRYRDLLGVRKGEGKRDALWVAIALVVSGPLGFLPNIGLGIALWGDAQVGADLMFRALPVAGAWAILIVFPLVHALTELPTYFGYVMPATAGAHRPPCLASDRGRARPFGAARLPAPAAGLAFRDLPAADVPAVRAVAGVGREPEVDDAPLPRDRTLLPGLSVAGVRAARVDRGSQIGEICRWRSCSRYSCGW